MDNGAGGRIGRSTPPTTPWSRGRRLASTTRGTDWMCPPSIPTAISWSSSSSETRRRKSRAAARRETVALLSMRAVTACRSAAVGSRLGDARRWATLGTRGRGRCRQRGSGPRRFLTRPLRISSPTGPAAGCAGPSPAPGPSRPRRPSGPPAGGGAAARRTRAGVCAPNRAFPTSLRGEPGPFGRAARRPRTARERARLPTRLRLAARFPKDISALPDAMCLPSAGFPSRRISCRRSPAVASLL